MGMNPQIREYLDFMQWFQSYYPLIHEQSWKCIPIPINHINTSSDLMHKTLIDGLLLQTIIVEYYNQRT